MSFRAYSLCILVATMLWPPPTAAGGPHEREGTAGQYHIKADFLNFDDVTKTYRARGNVSITSADQSLYADAVDLDERTKDAKGWGGVRFHSGNDWLTGTRIEMNLEEGTGIVYNGTLFIEESHFYVRGDEIEKTGKVSYYVKDDCSLTSCDGESPSWEITGTDLRVTVEGYGTIKHAAMRAKSIPVLYSPFVVFPAKTKRQTGLLVPWVLYSNTNGWGFIQPFFWAINRSSDATFYGHYMAHRGWKEGVEYRYVLSEESKFTAMYDFLYDEQIDDGTAPSGDGEGYRYEGFTGDSENRLNRKRWWFRMKADWELPAKFKAKLDADVVSDQDHLREFNTTYSGYDHTDSYFTEEFGRELDDETDTVRLNQLNLNRTWDQFSLNADLRWYDNVIVRNNDLDDTTQQSLPSVTFDGSKQQISDSEVYFDLSSSFDHYWREVGIRGYSMDVAPRIYYPLTVFEYFDFEPSVSFRETLWQVDRNDPASPKKEDQLRSREIPDFKADLSTEISRVFDLGGKAVDKMRHAIKPQVVYNYVPDVEQGDLPSFVGVIEESNLLSYSLTNTFTVRKLEPQIEKELELEATAWEAWAVDTPEGEAEEEWEPFLPKYGYHDFCRMTLSQTYDIHAARRPSSDGSKKKPFSDVTARLELDPFYSHDLKFVGNGTWSPYDGEYDYNLTVDLDLKNERGDWTTATFRYTRDSKSDILAKAFVHLFDTLSVFVEHEHNLKEKKEITSTLGFRYEPQCWSWTVKYTHDRAANRREYLFQISLYGLGEYDLGEYRPDDKDRWYKKG